MHDNYICRLSRTGAEGQLLSKDFLRGRGRSSISPADLNAFDEGFSEVREFAPNMSIVRANEALTRTSLVVDGFLCRYSDDDSGERQIVGIYVPGDLMDLHPAPLKSVAHSVCSLTTCTVAMIADEDLVSLLLKRPSLSQMLLYSSVLTAAIGEQWIFRMGRLSAIGRVCHQLCEIEARLNAIGRADQGRFSLPIKQQQLADSCGITAVHLNRVLGELRKSNVLTFRQGIVHMENRIAAQILAEFDPTYLNLDQK